tara:strand:+ start:1255 stop:1713 length:459 start_codon:yes stop_codon:yes gene_type:complete
MTDKLIKRTPCIGICSTTYGDDTCRGCRRYREEITSWIKYSDSEKNIVNRRLEKFKITVLQDKFKITDAEKLKTALKEARIRFNQDLDPICWIFDLFRNTSAENIKLSEFGICLKKDFDSVPLDQLKDDINNEFYDLSEAHYQRYIQPSFFT